MPPQLRNEGEDLLQSYLRRLGLTQPPDPTLAGLRQLHAAHVATIPFENLDILLGRRIELGIDKLRAKLVDVGRGGYCFEQNSLFLAVLNQLGYVVKPMEARVRVGSTSILPRTHMVLGVDVDGAEWLADVGFGGDGLIEPVSMQPLDVEQAQAGVSYRVTAEGRLRVLQAQSQAGWTDLYAFLPEEVLPVDFEVANWFTSTYPDSPFVRRLTAQRSTREVRYILRYPTYSEIRGMEVRTRDIGRHELLPLLREVFLIDLPLDTTFRVIDFTESTAGIV